MKKYYLTILVVLLSLQHSLSRPEENVKARSDDEFGDEDVKITKRSGSGSGDFLNHFKYNLAGTVSKTSAQLSSGSSSHSAPKGSSHGYKGNHIDQWSFKSSFFGTIKQAVKAITGGVTAIKGQLIKGSGYALAASGKVVAASGDKISDVGKATISAAQHQLAHPNYGESVHPFHKLSSLSGAASSSSSGAKETNHGKPPIVHHSETITTYEIPADHGHSGPIHPGHFSHIPHHKPSDAYIGSLPPHIVSAQDIPYEYHRHTYEGDNNNYYAN